MNGSSSSSIYSSPISASKSFSHAVDYDVGDKVSIQGTTKTGLVRWLGVPSFGEGEWVGLELASKDGHCDGSRDGIEYFSCKTGFGLFLHAAMCTKLPQKNTPLKVPTPFSQNALISNKSKLTGGSIMLPPETPSPATSARNTQRSSALTRSNVGTPPSKQLASITLGDFAELLKRVDNLEIAQRESSRTLNEILRIVQESGAVKRVDGFHLKSESGVAEDTLARIAELARKAQKELLMQK